MACTVKIMHSFSTQNSNSVQCSQLTARVTGWRRETGIDLHRLVSSCVRLIGHRLWRHRLAQDAVGNDGVMSYTCSVRGSLTGPSVGTQLVSYSVAMTTAACTGFVFTQFPTCYPYASGTLEPGYNDIGLYDTSPITSDILCYQLLTVNRNIILLCHNNTKCSVPFVTS
jgi:hypothetical protein